MKDMYNKFKKAITDLTENDKEVETPEEELREKAPETNKTEPVKKYKNVLCITLNGSYIFTSTLGTNTFPITLTLENKPWDIFNTNTLEPWQDLYDWFFNTDKPTFRWKYTEGEHILLRERIVTWNLSIQEDV